MSWAEEFKTVEDMKEYLKDHNKGLPPDNLKKMAVKSGNKVLKVTFTPPDDTVIEDRLLCTVKGVRILYKEGQEAIKDEEDGIVLADLEGEEMAAAGSAGYNIEGLKNDTDYMVAIMPYSDHYVYNRNKTNQKAGRPSEVQIWGFSQNFLDKNPETTLTYTDENESYSPMERRDDGSMNEQEWGDFPLILENLPYMVKKDGTADYQLNPDNYSQKVDGTPSDVANGNYAGGAFSWMKKVYMKETYAADGNSRHVQFAFSNGDIRTEDFKPIGFIKGGVELEGVWLPMFYMDSSGRTIAGTQPIHSNQAGQERTIIQNWSDRAVHLGGGLINVIRDLLYMFARSTDIQTHFGEGCMNAYVNTAPYYGVKANAVVGGGRFFGTTGGKQLNKIFHSIVLGSYQQLTRDPQTILSGGTMYVSTDYDIYSLTAAGYKNTGKTFASSSAWRYASKLQYVEDFGSIAQDDNGGTTGTGLCDGQYYNAAGVRVALRLGDCRHGLTGGPGYLHLNDEAGVANWTCGVGVLLLGSAGYAPKA